jgi:hypothetical protein
MKVENLQTPFTFCLLVATCCRNMAPKNTKNQDLANLGQFFTKNNLYTSKSHFSSFKNVKIFQKKKECLGLLEAIFKF